MLDKNCKCCNLRSCSGISKLNIIDLRIINNKRAPNHQQNSGLIDEMIQFLENISTKKYFQSRLFYDGSISLYLKTLNISPKLCYSLEFIKCMFLLIRNLFLGVRQEQDIYVRLIDSVTKQVRILVFNVAPFLKEHSFIMLSIKLQSEVLKGVS